MAAFLSQFVIGKPEDDCISIGTCRHNDFDGKTRSDVNLNGIICDSNIRSSAFLPELNNCQNQLYAN